MPPRSDLRAGGGVRRQSGGSTRNERCRRTWRVRGAEALLCGQHPRVTAASPSSGQPEVQTHAAVCPLDTALCPPAAPFTLMGAVTLPLSLEGGASLSVLLTGLETGLRNGQGRKMLGGNAAAGLDRRFSQGDREELKNE